MFEGGQLDAARAVTQDTVLHQFAPPAVDDLALALHYDLDAVPVHHVTQAVHSVSGLPSTCLFLGWRTSKAVLKVPLDSTMTTMMTGSCTVLRWRWHHLGLWSRAGWGGHGG